jgi:hypothetical protein
MCPSSARATACTPCPMPPHSPTTRSQPLAGGLAPTPFMTTAACTPCPRHPHYPEDDVATACGRVPACPREDAATLPTGGRHSLRTSRTPRAHAATVRAGELDRRRNCPRQDDNAATLPMWVAQHHCPGIWIFHLNCSSELVNCPCTAEKSGGFQCNAPVKQLHSLNLREST